MDLLARPRTKDWHCRRQRATQFNHWPVLPIRLTAWPTISSRCWMASSPNSSKWRVTWTTLLRSVFSMVPKIFLSISAYLIIVQGGCKFEMDKWIVYIISNYKQIIPYSDHILYITVRLLWERIHICWSEMCTVQHLFNCIA